MVQENLNYDPKRDLHPVSQDGYVNLVEAFKSRTIPSDVSSPNLEIVDCEDTDSLFPRAEDVFDVIQQSHTISQIPSDNKGADGSEDQ